MRIVWPHWRTGHFEAKLRAVLHQIDELTDHGHAVSLVGQSAGGSLALAAFAARPRSVRGMVNLAGRLRVVGQPSLEAAARTSPAFAESVRRAEGLLKSLPATSRRRIITIHPASDQLVPPTSVPIAGAINLASRLRGHLLGGALLASVAASRWMSELIKIDDTL